MTSTRPHRANSTVMPAPAHPVPQLQGPFEESMMESVIDVADNEANLDSYTRRTILLEKPQYERVVAGRWKQKPGERYHPLWKVVSQISFGLHLLAEGMARSEEEVMKILQTHVDDIDCFLERTTEDMELAQSDVSERLHYLQLPLQHVEVFDRMLEDRAFRMSIVEGNEKIEHIVERTSEAMRDTLKDVQKGLAATKALGQYLAELERNWERTTAEHEAVFVAMVGNVEGWGRAFMDLHLHGNRLKKSLAQLSQIVTEMQRRAGVVSRQFLPPSRQSHRSSQLTSESRPVSSNNRIYQSRDVRRPASAMTSSHKALPHPNERKVRLSAPRTQSDDDRRRSRSHQTAGTGPRPQVRQSASLPASTHQNDRGLRPKTPQQRSSKSPLRQITVAKVVDTSPPAQRTQAPPMELPAEVPKEALLHAPLSKKSRLSLHLGLRSRDSGDPKSTQRLSTKVLGALLKPGSSPRVATTPNSSHSRVTDASYATALTSHAEKEMGYFDAPDARLAVSTEIQEPVAEHFPTPPALLTPARSRSPAVSSRTKSPAGLRSPALSSHPPDMDMATASPSSSRAPLRSPSAEAKKPSNPKEERDESRASDLGEPGPEIEVSVPIEDTAQTSVHTKEWDENNRQPLAQSGSVAPRLGLGLPARDPESALPVVAELDGVTPQASDEKIQGLAELEASRHSFALPPRSSARIVVESSQDEVPTATIASQADFFRLPPGQVLQSSEQGPTGNTPSISGRASPLPPSRDRHVASSRFERSNAPVRLRTPRKDAPRNSKLRASLIDQFSDTPPGSPIHARGLSDASSNSAQLHTDHRSRLHTLADEAPPPPPPGGRRMASVDYASAAQFDGERKSKRNSAASSSTWKKFLSGRASPLSDGGQIQRSGSAENKPEVQSHNDMMTAGGKDVLWFKGMGSNGVWVS